jgi:hypothetical protein
MVACFRLLTGVEIEEFDHRVGVGVVGVSTGASVIEMGAAEYRFVRNSGPFAEKVWFIDTTTRVPRTNVPI